MNTKIIHNFIKSTKTSEVFGYRDGVVRLTRDGNRIVVEYKDNNMPDFGWGMDINIIDVKPLIAAKAITAFINA